jgi:type II secretory ATPase GspE/PulE/Tfp pilus assembly ATPase PilB-like protein
MVFSMGDPLGACSSFFLSSSFLSLDLGLFAVGAFPRGPGFYFNPAKIAVVLVIYLMWVRTCWWVDHDCRELKLPTPLWNPLVLGCGLAGLLLVWALPVFWASCLALVTLYLAPTVYYIVTRNEKVPADKRVMTPKHLEELANRYLAKLGFGRKRVAEKDKLIPIRFIGKSGDTRSIGADDAARVRRVQESEQYRLGLEIVYNAILMRGTDIHMEPTKDDMTIRYRIDGILQAIPPLDRHEGDSVLNIFKVLAALDITEKRQAQDGSFSAEVQTPIETNVAARKLGLAAAEEEMQAAPRMQTRQVDFRVATAGSVAGEKMVLRILDRSRAIGDVSKLGMRDRMRDTIRSIVTQPHGMFIVCGPTGAGKSTTLYACLAEIDRYQKNVITVENPVEYHIDNVTQIEINPKAGKTFATELRSILRQDPDVIYIGEIRDNETAEIACQAAQTGHMVFTTLHANDTVMALGRLMELGVKPFMVGSSVSAILGQRLVRVLCPKCKVGYRPKEDLLRKMRLPADRIKLFYRPPKVEDSSLVSDNDPAPKKCAYCNGTGYRGRTGIFELLVINEKIREMVKDNPNLDAIRQEAIKAGTVLLSQDGMRVVIEGETSIDELLRVSK